MKSQVTHSPGSKLNLEVKITHPLIVPVRRVELLLIKSGCNIWTILSCKSFFLKGIVHNFFIFCHISYFE